METAFDERLTRLERDVRRIDRELAELRLEVTEVPEPKPLPSFRPAEPEPRPAPAPEPPRAPAAKPFELPSRPRRELDLSVLLGAKKNCITAKAVPRRVTPPSVASSAGTTSAPTRPRPASSCSDHASETATPAAETSAARPSAAASGRRS